jgi:tRNA threonylcarbamoyl adenosine modification protein (Sua5/YciO/YrdC/YwlC family)
VITEWDPERPRKKTTELIRETLLLGGLIAYPTDTIYGIGCDLFNIKAIRKLYAMKRLDSRRALSIICRDLKEISAYAVMGDFAFDVLKRHLPGPYTFVLKAKRIMPKLMMTEKKEVGIRIPDHPVPVGLAALIEHPIINTSARIGSDEVFTDPRQIEKAFQKNISIIIDGGIISGEASTVIRVSEEDGEVEIMRQGKGLFLPSGTGR